MTFPIVPVAVFGLAGVAAWQAKKRHTGMTPEREKIFIAAMRTLENPQQLNKLAEEFQKANLGREALLLKKRAALRSLPEATKEARREAFRTGIRCLDPEKVEKLAKAFHNEGCFKASDTLNLYASGLRAVDKIEIEKIAKQLDGMVGERNKDAVKILQDKAK